MPSMRAAASGDRVGRYELLEEIGEGGMATVFRARDPQLRREVAVKVLFPHLAKRADVVRRFAREARAAAALEHPNILRVLDVGVPDGTSTAPPYLVMELIRGQSLAEFCQAHGPLPPEHAAAMIAQIADALRLAHAAGIVHRDIKPANVMATRDGRLLLADFGVAHVATDESLVTRTGALLGTPAYMSPEQAAGEDITAASDVYSLAVTLYQMVTGELPYGGSTAKVLSQIVAGGAVPADRKVPSVGAQLARIIARAMTPAMATRTPTAAQFADELTEFVVQSGLGDTASLVKEVLADPALAKGRQPELVALLTRRAQVALTARQHALASGLAERAHALAPTDAQVTALLSSVAHGQRWPRWWPWLAGASVAAAVSMAALLWRSNRADGTVIVDGRSVDAALAAPRDVAVEAVVDAPGRDAATIAAMPHDAPSAVRADARVRRDARGPAIDAQAKVDAEPIAALMHRDAALAMGATDAAPTAALDVVVQLSMDSWCDVSIDGQSRGRLRRGQALLTSPGTHTISCSQGVGMAEWHTSFSAVAGQAVTLSGHLLTRVRITAALGAAISIDRTRVNNGDTVVMPTGRYPVTVWDGAQAKITQWVPVPAVAACTLRVIAGVIECTPP
ncbi:MAG: serine/threonine protein kinase [Kofleriaceae bacterium]|nr:serine/threonine protein kinase [Kofleriaceae bacterium]